jgi:hypothetical protein
MLDMPNRVRDALSVALVGLIFVAGLTRELFVLPFIDRTPLQRELEVAADRPAPQYPAFLEEVQRRTEPREPIALLFRAAQADAPWWYAYFRARYFLLDRVVLPVAGMDGLTHPEYLDQARLVAAWGVAFEDPRFRTVWQGSGGKLARRVP